jgi:Flp pilus assembly protein TadD
MASVDGFMSRNPGEAASKKEGAAGDPSTFQLVKARLKAVYASEGDGLRYFERAVADDPADPFAHYGLGLALARSGRFDPALDHLRTALEKRAFDGVILSDLGRVYFQAGRYSEALNTLEGARAMGLERPETLFLLGRVYTELGRLEEAVRTLERLASLHDDYPEVHYYLGNAYGRWGQMDQAHYHLGVNAGKRGDRDNAVFHLRKALELTGDPKLRDRARDALRDELEGTREELGREGVVPKGFSLRPGRSGRSAW